MSASVDQRNKGQPNQVSNGPSKDTVKEPEFDPYANQQQQQQQQQMQPGYGAAPMPTPNVSDPYSMPSYYPSMSFPYGLSQGGLASTDGAWSNGSEAMSFLGGYGQVGNDYMSSNGMFGGFGYQPGFGWEYGDFSAWGASSAAATQGQARKGDDRGYAEGYYSQMPPDPYSNQMANGGEMDREMKAVDQGLKGVSIAENHDDHVKSSQYTERSSGGQSSSSTSARPSQPAKKSWASIASQPAKPQPQLKSKTIPRAPVLPGKHNMEVGTWDGKNNAVKQGQGRQQAWGGNRSGGRGGNGQGSYGGGSNGGATSNGTNGREGSGPSNSGPKDPLHPVLDKLKSANQYNPKEFNMNPKGTRFFIIKSYSEDDIHRSIKYSIWCSTEHGNKRLDGAYREREGKGPVFLLYSVNGSGHFCGMAQMMSPVDYSSSSEVWAQDKWKGQFEVKWIYVKDVPNSQLRHIRLENNENKPVTNSRDTQEVPPEKGKQVLKIIHQYRHTTSIFDDFSHYEKRQEEEVPPPPMERERENPREGREGKEGREGRDDRNNRRKDDRGDGRGEGRSEGRGEGRSEGRGNDGKGRGNRGGNRN